MTTPTSPKRPADPTKSGNGAALWIGIVAVVVILGVAAVLLSRNANDEATDDVSTGQTSDVQVGASTTVGDAAATTPDGTEPTSTSLPVYDANGEDPAVGMTIPTVTGKDFEGNDVTIAADGKAKVLLFVAHWCPHCQREIPLLKEHLDDTPMPDDVELITISTSVKPGAENYPPQEWLEGEGWTAPVLVDDELSSVAQAYGLSAFPYFVVVDADGKVVARASGELSTEQFDAAVAAAQG